VLRLKLSRIKRVYVGNNIINTGWHRLLNKAFVKQSTLLLFVLQGLFLCPNERDFLERETKMAWEPSEAFYEWVRKNKASAAKEYQTVAQEDSTKDTHQTKVSEEDLSAVRSLRYLADKLERGEKVDHEIAYLLNTKLIRDWQDKQPKATSTGWGNSWKDK